MEITGELIYWTGFFGQRAQGNGPCDGGKAASRWQYGKYKLDTNEDSRVTNKMTGNMHTKGKKKAGTTLVFITLPITTSNSSIGQSVEVTVSL